MLKRTGQQRYMDLPTDVRMIYKINFTGLYKIISYTINLTSF